MLLKDKASIPSTSTVTYLLPTMKIFHSFTCSLLLGFDSVNSFTSLPFDPSHHHKSIAIMSSSSRTNDETSTSSTAKPILQPLPSLSSPQIQSHSTFLLDMWGVLHDGSQPYEGVLDAIEMLKKEGKTLVILSNSSKRREDAEKMLVKREFAWLVGLLCGVLFVRVALHHQLTLMPFSFNTQRTITQSDSIQPTLTTLSPPVTSPTASSKTKQLLSDVPTGTCSPTSLRTIKSNGKCSSLEVMTMMNHIAIQPGGSYHLSRRLI